MTALATTSTSKLAASSPALLNAVDDLFNRFKRQFGVKLADLFMGTEPEKVHQEWAEGLAGYRGRELRRGLDAVRTRKFAPVLGEFLQMCRPALDPEYAWHEAQAGLQARDRGEVGEWSHPAVWRAASAMQYELRHGSFSSCRRRWEMTLNREFTAGWGDEVPQPAARINHAPTLKEIPSEIKRKLLDLSRTMSRSGR